MRTTPGAPLLRRAITRGVSGIPSSELVTVVRERPDSQYGFPETWNQPGNGEALRALWAGARARSPTRIS
jgi:hypothetical protein